MSAQFRAHTRTSSPLNHAECRLKLVIWHGAPLVRGIPPIRSRRGPRRRRPAKLHADKGYDHGHLRRWLHRRGIRHRIARKGIESSQRLDRRVADRTASWLAGCRPLHRRFLAYDGIAAALISYRRLTN
jgi:hypothetical protein